MVDLGDWNELLAPLFKDERYQQIRKFLFDEYNNHVVYPDMYDLFNCFRYTPFAEVKVVLLGQDPYHNEGQAHGLCFSVQEGIAPPPSLVNIFQELHDDDAAACGEHAKGEPHRSRGLAFAVAMIHVDHTPSSIMR